MPSPEQDEADSATANFDETGRDGTGPEGDADEPTMAEKNLESEGPAEPVPLGRIEDLWQCTGACPL